MAQQPGYGYPDYPPPQQQGYPPSYPPVQQPSQVQQQSTNVVLVQQPQQTVVQHVRDDKPSHILHCIITFFCWPWVFVWLILCCIYGC